MLASFPTASLQRGLLVLRAFAVLLLAPTALAQPSLSEHGTATGTLSAGSDTLNSGEYAEAYTLTVSTVAPFEVALTASAFDPYLIVVAPSGRQYDNDDWENSRTEARVRIAPGQAEVGDWRVTATTYAVGQTGAYRLEHRTTEATPLVVGADGAQVAGTLAAGAETRGDGQFVTSYTFGVAGDGPLEFRLSSFAFDPYLVVRPPGLPSIPNDDWGSAYESRVYVPAGASNRGPWEIKVSSYGVGETGPFTLTYRPLTESGYAQAQADEEALLRAESLRGTATAHYEAGRYSEAVAPLREALALREAVLGARHPSVAQILNDLALALEAQRDHAAARLLYDRALALYEETFGPDHPQTAVTLGNLAVLLQAQGDYAAARPLFEQALAALEAAHGPEHADVAPVLNNLAELLRVQGDYAAARPLYERALAIREAALGGDDPDVAATLSNLAVLSRAEGDYAAARPLYERALAIDEAAFGPDHPAVARDLNNLALLLDTEGDEEGARPLYERALALQEAAFGPEHPFVANALNNLAGLFYEQRDYRAAQPLYERALAIREATQRPEHPDVALALHNLAATAFYTGEGAAPLALRAARLYDRAAARVLPTLAGAEQRAFVDLDLADAAGLALSTHREGSALADAYAVVGGWKGLLLDGLRRQAAVAALASDPAHAADVARLQTLRAHVARAYREGAPELEALTEEKERLERQLARALPAGAAGDPWREAGRDGLGTALPEGAAFVDVYRAFRWATGQEGDWRYTAVVTAQGASPVLVDLGAADSLDARASAWRQSVTRGESAAGETADLGAALWGPVARALGAGTARVWVSPDGALVGVPWAALAAAHPPTAPLLVAQVPSARDLLALLTSAPAADDPAGGPSLLLVGDVDFDAGRGASAADGSPFAPLPGTATEVAALARLAGDEGLGAEVLTGETPTAPAVSAALADAVYVHLATHGFFYGEDEAAYAARGAGPSTRTEVIGSAATAPVAGLNRNPLVESGLALAGANTGAEGLLTAEEVVGLDLSGTRLVVLSACETGRGTEVTGQGVLGLQASFTAAGARALLMSLWSVPDASTAALMEAFYRGLWEGGLRPAAALAQAQAEVRARPEWSSPVHWAAWVLSGDAF